MPHARILAAALIVAVALMPWITQSSRANDATSNDADAIIEACWDATLDKRSSGVNSEMHQGIIESVDCLESAILDQVEVLFPNGKYMSIGRAEDLLQMIGWGVGRYYLSLYNDNIRCQEQFCGTQWYSAHSSKIAEIFQAIIRDTIAIRNRYHLQPKSGAR